jgi:hypothetical protein
MTGIGVLLDHLLFVHDPGDERNLGGEQPSVHCLHELLEFRGWMPSGCRYFALRLSGCLSQVDLISTAGVPKKALFTPDSSVSYNFNCSTRTMAPRTT